MWPAALICLCAAAMTATGKSTSPSNESELTAVPPASSSTDPPCPAGDHWSQKASRCCRTCPTGAGATGPCASYTFSVPSVNDKDNNGEGNDDSTTVVTAPANNNNNNNNNNSNADKIVVVDGCEQCQEGLTYSASRSFDQPCRTCSTCPKNSRLVSACNMTRDTVCECEAEFYLARPSGQCKLCDMCPAGWGVQTPCGLGNTACHKCHNGTYSDVLSATDPCRTCRVCSEEERMLQECTATQDTICLGKYANIPPPYIIRDDDGPVNFPGGERQNSQPVQDDDSGIDVIPLYCAALGAVVVGLIFYVAFVHYRRMRDKRMSREPHEDVEYSKASGGDSGVFGDLDHQHNHHQQKYHCAVMTGSTRLRDVPQGKRKELERTLLAGSRGPADWKALARELGYNSGKITSWEPRNGRDPGAPYRHVLHDWSRLEGATVAAFLRALRNTGRHDVVKFLQAECAEQLQPLTSTLPQHIV